MLFDKCQSVDSVDISADDAGTMISIAQKGEL